MERYRLYEGGIKKRGDKRRDEEYGKKSWEITEREEKGRKRERKEGI
jgi:hypothetical protein